MQASKTEIANMALSHLGIGKEINDLDTEKSQEAGACRRYFEIARDSSLEEFNWPFARKFSALALVDDNSAVAIDPSGYPEWRYYYQLPSDCLTVRRVLSGSKNDSRQTRVPYLQVGSLLFTDMENAEIEYTAQASDPALYPNDFGLAFSYLLASLIAPRITGGDNFQIGKMAFQQYQMMIEKAKARGLNSEQVPVEVESEFTRARDGSEARGWIDRSTFGGF